MSNLGRDAEATSRVDATQEQPADAALTVAVCNVLLDSLCALADAGEVGAACRLAGRACVSLRRSQPALARRFDVLLHRLTPKLTWKQPPASP